MVRPILVVAALCGLAAIVWPSQQAFGFQFAARQNQEPTQKKVSSRKTVTKPARDSSATETLPLELHATHAPTTTPTPLVPMIQPEPTTPDEVEATIKPTATEANAGESTSSEPPHTVANQLALQTKVTVPRKTIVKQPARVAIEVANEGPALADPAILIVWLPKHVQLQSSEPQLTRQANGSYEYLISELSEQATQSFSLEIVSKSFEPILVRTQIQMLASQEAEIKVERPELVLEVTAPEFSFQNAENIYSIDVRNDSPVELSQVRVVVRIPEGLNVTMLNRAAAIDDQARTLTWEIGRLGGAETDVIEFKATAQKSGTVTCQITGESAESEACEVDLTTTIGARPDLKIGLNAPGGPIQLHQTATLEMTVENRGTEVAKDVELEVLVPEALQAVAGDGYEIQRNRLVFPAADLSAGQVRTIELRFSGIEPGEHVVRAELKSATQRTIATEDTVFVYDAATPRTGSTKSRRSTRFR